MVDFLNKEVLQIAGYNIHVAFFLLLALVLGLLVVLLLIISKKNTGKEVGALRQNRIKVTDWQRQRVGDFLMKEREEFVENNGGEIDEDTGEKHIYVSLLDEFYNYLKTEDNWDPEKLKAIDENFLLVFNSILIEKSKELYIEGDANSSLLILHMIDLMNGGDYLYGRSDEWIGSDVDEMLQHDAMDVQEARLFSKSLASIYSLAGVMYTSEGVRRGNLPSYLDHITVDELDETLNDIQNAMSFTTLKEGSYDVLVFAFYNEIDSYLKRMTTGEELKEFQLYDVRCLMSALDFAHETYDFIVSTIE